MYKVYIKLKSKMMVAITNTVSTSTMEAANVINES